MRSSCPDPVADAGPEQPRSGRLARALRIAWAAPCTAVGLVLFAPAGFVGARLRRVDGTLELALCPRRPGQRRWADRLPFNAITFGHLIAAVDAGELDRLRAHERVHVAQYERWGLLFFLAYPLASLAPWLRGRRAYVDNRFEVAARAGAARWEAQSAARSSAAAAPRSATSGATISAVGIDAR